MTPFDRGFPLSSIAAKSQFAAVRQDRQRIGKASQICARSAPGHLANGAESVIRMLSDVLTLSIAASLPVLTRLQFQNLRRDSSPEQRECMPASPTVRLPINDAGRLEGSEILVPWFLQTITEQSDAFPSEYFPLVGMLFEALTEAREEAAGDPWSYGVL
ncbi:hypothetical protein B0H10DRAFT_2194817 [Mycena sp. CBHHK59/15]|nr:hypothetical protein B0H10DRAFT_2194817 [Mycena sp. CBHHK59/15]